MGDPEVTRLLPRQLGNTQTMKWGMRCLLLVQMFNLARYTGVIHKDMVVPILYFKDMRTVEWLRAFFVAYTVIAYFAPILVGWYSDTRTGRYEMIFFGKGISLTAIIIRIVIILLCYLQVKMGTAEMYVLQGLYVVSTIFNYVSLWMVLQVTMVFGAQQIDQSDDRTLTSFFRWNFMFMNGGIIIQDIVLLSFEKEGLSKEATIMGYTISCLVTDSLAVVFLILGKRVYDMKHLDGSKSLKEAWRIFLSHIGQGRARRNTFEASLLDSSSESDLAHRVKVRQLERLAMRRFVLMLAVMTVSGVFMSLWFEHLYVLRIYTKDGSAFHAVLLRDSLYVTSFGLVPIMQIISRRCTTGWYHRNCLKIMGTGMVLAAVALFVSGAFHYVVRMQGGDSAPKHLINCQVLGYIIMGLACNLVYPALFEFSYRESHPSVACLNSGISLSLGWGISTTISLVVDVRESSEEEAALAQETTLYSLAGLMLAVLLAVFLPVSLWYTKVRQDIDIAETELRRMTEQVNLVETMHDDWSNDCHVTLSSDESESESLVAFVDDVGDDPLGSSESDEEGHLESPGRPTTSNGK